MGVRGLTTFISRNRRKYFQKHKLRDCYVIIDGNSLAYNLYLRFVSKAHCAFGGDYERFTHRVVEFFEILSQCGIKPIVLFDGGYEPRKVATVIGRMQDRLSALRHVDPGSKNCSPIFPLLMKTVMKEVLRKVNVPFVQCDFEADREIASLARKYNCPVLSNDSDFFIFDVSYIPIPTLDLEVVAIESKEDETCKYYMRCEIFTVEFFLNSFGGLDKSMLPLLATLLGNDYIRMAVFKKVFAHFRTSKRSKGSGNATQKRIAHLIQWLRNETFDTAVNKVLSKLKKKRHENVKLTINRITKIYTDLSTTVESYLPPEFLNSIQNPDETLLYSTKMINLNESENAETMDIDSCRIDDDDDLNSLKTDESSLSDDEIKDDDGDGMDIEAIDQTNDKEKLPGRVKVKIPDSVRDNFRRGYLETSVFDILTLQTYFSFPQIEDHYHVSSFMSSLPLLKKISKLLLGDCCDEIILWMRSRGYELQKFLLSLNNTPKIADIGSISTLSIDARKSLFLQTLDIPKEFCLDDFPDDWKVYICTILFWIKNTSEPPVTECHVISLLMCIVALSIIEDKVGYFNKKIGFLKKYGKLQRKILKRMDKDVTETESNDEESEDIVIEEAAVEKPDCSTIKQIVSSISVEDCVAVFVDFFHLHQLDENIKMDQKIYSKRTVHSFAQFQNCLYHVLMLNSLLDHPFDRPTISRFYSGTFIYNTCVTLMKPKNVIEYIQTFLRYSPNILKLIESVFSALKSVTDIAVVTRSSRKPKRKRRKKVSETVISDEDNADVEICDGNKTDEEENHFHDVNNVFSLLSNMANV